MVERESAEEQLKPVFNLQQLEHIPPPRIYLNVGIKKLTHEYNKSCRVIESIIYYPAKQEETMPVVELQESIPDPHVVQVVAVEPATGWNCPGGQLSQVLFPPETTFRYLYIQDEKNL